MTSLTRLFAYSYRLFKKCFMKIKQIQNFPTFLSDLHQIFSLFCLTMFAHSFQINQNLERISPLTFMCIFPSCKQFTRNAHLSFRKLQE